MVRHTNQCGGQNAHTSPLGNIASDDHEVEVSLPVQDSVSDPHMAGINYATPEKTQSGEDNSRVSTESTMSINDEPTLEIEEQDPLQLSDEIEVKENLYTLIDNTIPEKEPLQEYGKTDNSDGSEFKVLPFIVSDEILSSPNISFSTKDNTKTVSADLPTTIKDKMNLPVTRQFPPPSVTHQTTTLTLPLKDSTGSKLPYSLSISHGQTPQPTTSPVVKVSKSEEGLRRTIPEKKIKKWIILQKAGQRHRPLNGYLYGLEDL